MSSWRERQVKKVEAEKTKSIELNEINFPSLTAGTWSETSKNVSKKTGRTFASLAKEWNEHAEREQIRIETEKQRRRIEQYEIEQVRKRRTALYNFGNSHAREEDTYYDDTQEDEYISQVSADTSKDWRTVSKKIRKPPSTFNSAAFQPPSPIQEVETQWDQDPYE